MASSSAARGGARSLILSLAVVVFAGPVRADEGMWLFNQLPLDQLKQKHGFAPDDAWTNHVMRSCVRFGQGSSGSFVSRDGLILTNHHVALSSIQAVSTPQHDYVRDGFLAKSREQELRVPGLEVMALMSIEDVTERVNAAVRADMSADQADKARKAAMASIEKESLGKTGLRSEVVTLYGGFQFHLYRYKTYADVRLAFAPEYSVGFFGGDPDNFEYPRYCLDAALLRACDEHGKPARVEHFLKWSSTGVADGELVFVAGHPRRTDRLMTSAALAHERDVRLPYLLDVATRAERTLLDYAARGPEQARQAAEKLFGVQNWLKRMRGQMRGLGGPDIISAKTEWERTTRHRVAVRVDLKQYADAWERVEAAVAHTRSLHPRLALLEDRADAFDSELFSIARTLVRLAAEDKLPDEKRLREYNDSRRESLETTLFSDKPIYPEFEAARLASSLELMRRKLGEADARVVQILAGKPPADRAAELVKGSRLADVNERRRLKAGGQRAIDASDDAMIRLVVLVDPESRRLRASREANVDEPLLRAYADLSKLIFALDGPGRYPDATGTLRLSVGIVRGCEQDGQKLSPWTTVAGTFDNAASHGNEPPWKLPDAWHAARKKLAPGTPFNFVSTADIVGGNSGSPTLNRAGEVVGVLFDGNRFSLANGFHYSEDPRRSVHVDARAIAELMEKVYGAGALLAEIRAVSP